jgi:erythromycin esterase-like protein
MSRDGHIAEEEFFSAEQNARLVMNAERYYRAMFHGRDESWNLRDTHMFETLNELAAHLDSGRAKVVVWAHNSHLGNARATEMSERGELNVGQLVRERFGEKALLIGFSMYSGTVTAARAQGCATATRSFSTRREFRVSG